VNLREYAAENRRESPHPVSRDVIEPVEVVLDRGVRPRVIGDGDLGVGEPRRVGRRLEGGQTL